MNDLDFLGAKYVLLDKGLPFQSSLHYIVQESSGSDAFLTFPNAQLNEG